MATQLLAAQRRMQEQRESVLENTWRLRCMAIVDQQRRHSDAQGRLAAGLPDAASRGQGLAAGGGGGSPPAGRQHHVSAAHWSLANGRWERDVKGELDDCASNANQQGEWIKGDDSLDSIAKKEVMDFSGYTKQQEDSRS